LLFFYYYLQKALHKCIDCITGNHPPSSVRNFFRCQNKELPEHQALPPQMARFLISLPADKGVRSAWSQGISKGGSE
jgi:hypothetical protein